jgi:hypothetical protein
MRYEIAQDDGPHENPLDWNEWELHSFNRRHINFKSPENYGLSINNYGEVETTQIGLRRKLDTGTAYVLSYYEHGQCSWFLKGHGLPGSDCQWDGTRVAGLLIWKGKAKDCGKDRKEREKHAISITQTYTDWCNGNVYGFRIFDDEDNEVDSCWGFYGYEHAEESAKEAMEGLVNELATN